MSVQPVKIPAYSRSRQTVVCTECKRLKVKCDRQSPCSCCAKRSNDPRVCVYMTANTERPDVGVLWNNQREIDLKVDSLAARVDEMHDAFLPRPVPTPSLTTLTSSGTITEFTVDSVTFLWTTLLSIPLDRVCANSQSGTRTPTSILFSGAYNPDLLQAFFSSNQYPNSTRPTVSAALMSRLPVTAVREMLMDSLTTTLIIHPICSLSHLEPRLRNYDQTSAGHGEHGVSLAFFAVAAAACALGALSYQAERRAWRLQPEHSDVERDPTRLYEIARHALFQTENLADEEQADIVIAGLFLIVFVLHSLELDGHKAVISGVTSAVVRKELRKLLSHVRFVADEMDLLTVRPSHSKMTLFKQEERQMLAAAVAYYEFVVADLLGDRVSLDTKSYTTPIPSAYDEAAFKPNSNSLPPASSNSVYRTSLFASHRAKMLKVILQARQEVSHARELERDQALGNKATSAESQCGVNALDRTAGETLSRWQIQLHQQRDYLPYALNFDTSPEFATDVRIVFAGEARPIGVYEPRTTLSMGLSIAQQAELAALNMHQNVRHAALLLENSLQASQVNQGTHPSAGSSNLIVASTVALGSARGLINVLRTQRHVLKRKMPLALSNYAYLKRIFDTAVVFATLAIPNSTVQYETDWARSAAEGLAQCIELYRDLEGWLRAKEGGPEVLNPSASIDELPPAIRILEELAERAGIRVKDGAVESVSLKRKRTAIEIDDASLDGKWDGFSMPFVMGGYTVGPSRPPAWMNSARNGSMSQHSLSMEEHDSFSSGHIAFSPEEEQDGRPTKRPKRQVSNHGQIAPTLVADDNEASSDEGSQWGDEKSKRRTSDSTSNTSGRPGSATKPMISIRDRSIFSERKPKKRTSIGDGQKLPKREHSADHLESVDESTENIFTFTIQNSSTNNEYQHRPSPVNDFQYMTHHPQQLAPQQQPHMNAYPHQVEMRSTSSKGDTSSSDPSPSISNYAPPTPFNTDSWSEDAFLGQQHLVQNQGRYAMQSTEGPYMQQPKAQQPVKPNYMQMPPQDYRTLPPAHMMYHSYGYSDGSSQANDSRPHPHPTQLVIPPNMKVGGPANGPHQSQPSSAVQMHDPNMFYSSAGPHPSNANMYGRATHQTQEQQYQGWAPAQPQQYEYPRY